MSTKKTVRKKSKKTSAQEVKIDISVKQEPVPSLALAPIQGDGGKFMIPKTWMSEKQVTQMVQKTPPQYIYRRRGKGGQDFDYVTGWYVTKVLNYVFGWNWDFEVVDKGREQDQVWVLGKLTVKDDHGHVIVKSQFGRADLKFFKAQPTRMVDFGNDMKAAATDALKKCASELGIASDVYGTAEYAEEGVKVAYTPTPAPKATQIAKQGAIKTTGAATPPLKAPEVPAASNSPARAKLFALAREYGAVAGKEQKLVESALKMKINWPKCTEKNLEMIYSQFLDKSSR